MKPFPAAQARCRFLRDYLFRGSLALGIYLTQSGLGGLPAPAQTFDWDFLPKTPPHPASAPSLSNRRPTPPQETDFAPKTSTPEGVAPLSVTVSKTLYLPPAMYGQWSVSGVLLETNAREYFSPIVNDIWILAREGDRVVLSNPANGASADVRVDRVEGERATFYREGLLGRNRAFQEIPTITVLGDTLMGQSINKIRFLKNGAPVREAYAIYRLEAQRIAGSRIRFLPDEHPDTPDIRIDDVRSAR